jgi:hypothetical protein
MPLILGHSDYKNFIYVDLYVVDPSIPAQEQRASPKLCSLLVFSRCYLRGSISGIIVQALRLRGQIRFLGQLLQESTQNSI